MLLTGFLNMSAKTLLKCRFRLPENGVDKTESKFEQDVPGRNRKADFPVSQATKPIIM
jgi:hypothetical protein